MRSQLRLRVLVPVAVLALFGLGVGAFAFTGTPGGSKNEPLSRAQPPTKKKTVAAPTVSRRAWTRRANAICAELNAETAALGTPQSRQETIELVTRALALAEESLGQLRSLGAPHRDAARVNRMLALYARFVKAEKKALAALEQGDLAGFARLNGAAFSFNDRGNRIARELGARECAEGGSDDSELAKELERHRVVVAVLYSPESALDRLAIREARAGAAEANVGFVAIDVYNPRQIAPVAAEYPVRGAPAVLVFARFRGAVTQIPGYVDRETIAQAADNADV